MFKEFKPKPAPLSSQEEIRKLCTKGDLNNARKQCKKAGYQFNDFTNEINIGARKMVISHRTGELLSFIYNYEIKVEYDIPTLLNNLYELPDYHSFLKNAHRFKIYKGLEDKIDDAINQLLKKGQTADAEGWRRKINSLKE
ncbi:MAG TPA: hypothetical protein PLL26_06560 [Candidatus Dojkabacteria bacterium]|nr:hypothetical protein [Candidatus Dojkabacteria bacterium]